MIKKYKVTSVSVAHEKTSSCRCINYAYWKI